MISLVLFILASICSSVMDVTSFHFETSIFSKLNPKFWNESESWKNKYQDWDGGNFKRKKLIWNINLPVCFTDSWHMFKTTMIFLVVGAIVLYKPTLSCFDLGFCKPLLYLFDFVLFGTAWNCMFNIFFNRILVKKN